MPTTSARIYHLGWHPDPVKAIGDKPDYDAEPLLGASMPPVAASASHLVAGIFNQGALSSCVANAGFQAIRAAQIRAGATAATASRLFGYFFARAIHAATKEDQGTYIRLFFQAMNTFGFPQEQFWPYNEALVNKMPSKNAIRMAFDQLAPTKYYRITSTGSERIRDIKRAIAEKHLVVFGTTVGQAFGSSHIKPNVPLGPPDAGTWMGGHAMCIDAYNGDNFSIVNSWGTDWGDSGRCLFSADYLEWYRSNDFWVVDVAPNFSENETTKVDK